MKLFFTIIGLIIIGKLNAQTDEFPSINRIDFEQKNYTIDSSANAIVILEKGKTHIESSDADRAYMVFHQYKVRIKILKTEGFEKANFTLPLYKFGSTFEYIRNVTATTSNLIEGRITSSSISSRDIITENRSEYVKLSKFTLPNIQIGSILDVEYTVVSPDIFNFRSWQFQTDIPKLQSEYNVSIPAVYRYNVTLKGALKLKDTKSKVFRECLSIYNTRVDCSNITYSMENIPAFKEEAYMLAPKNYISAINFELEEVLRPGGASQKYTKEWKNVDIELLTDRNFGGQLKKEEFFRKNLASTNLSTINNNIEKAQFVYYWIQNNIRWNNYYGKYSQYGVEDALTKKSGNVADINLALINALNAADLEAYPVLVSSRDNGIPNNIHPVISDFNYVIAAVKLDEEIILLDATDPLLAFSALPLRAINEKGRIIYSKKSSEWIPLENKLISATNYKFDGKLNMDGSLTGTLSISHNGLDGYNKRSEILNYPTIEEYQEKLDERLSNIEINKMEVHSLKDAKNNLVIDMDVKVLLSHPLQKGDFNLQPIFISRTSKNPFNLDERNYHVDLGARRDETHEINIEMPDGVTLKSAPKNSSMALPENSARYLYKSEFANQKLSVTQYLSLKKAIYSTDEYFGLKELFSRVIQQLQVDYLFSYNN